MGKNTLNAAEMRRTNRSLVLEHIRSGECSRIELARKTGLTRAAISVIVDELLKEGLLIQGRAKSGSVGRRAIGLHLNPNAFYVIGLNISRSEYTLGIIDFCGNVIKQIKKSINNRMPDHILHDIEGELIAILEIPPPGKLLGMGITAPGPLDAVKGKLLNPPNFEKWHDIPLVNYFNNKFNCPVILENNSKALALAEKVYGVGKQYDSFFGLVVDTGIGGGFINKGRLFQGSLGFGTEIGHTSIDCFGAKCSCGNYGCVEMYASIPKIIEWATTLNRAFNDWKLIVDEAMSGDLTAYRIVEKEAEYLSCIITTIVQILDVPAIVIFGDLTYKFMLIQELISSKVNSRILSRGLGKIEILESQLSTAPAILASGNMIIDNYIRTGDSI